jgi:UrcA family protein
MKIAIGCTVFAVLMGSLNAVSTASEPGNEPAKRVVHFADLDLTSNTGVAVLYKRLRFAALAVCEPVYDHRWQSVVGRNRCMSEAIARAVADVNSPMLTTYHLTQTKKTGHITVLAEKQ